MSIHDGWAAEAGSISKGALVCHFLAGQHQFGGFCGERFAGKVTLEAILKCYSPAMLRHNPD